MSINTTFEEQIATRVGATAHAPLAGLDEIAARAERRDRRSRIMGGLGTFVVVALVVIGVGATLREPDPSAVFAGEPSELIDPWQIRSFGAGFVGLSSLDVQDRDDFGNVQLIAMTSPDGDAWYEVANSPILRVTSASIDVGADGTLHIVTVRDTADGHQIHHTTSTDLRSWTSREHALPDLEQQDRQLSVRSIVAGQVGVLALVDSSPAFELIDESVVAEVGDLALCEAEFRPSRYRVRPCGSLTSTSVTVDSPNGTWATSELLFAAPGEAFQVVDAPTAYGRFAAPRPEIYRTSDGFGFVDYNVHHSVDGLEWRQIELDDVGNWLAAARGSELVFRSRNTFSGPDGPNGPPKEWGYSPDAGDTPMWLSPEDVWGERVEPFFLSLHAGDAGWVLLAGRRADPVIDEQAGQAFAHGYRDFSMTSGGMTLAGGPFPGPATLTDQDGRLVRSWEIFEFSNLEWAGFERTETGVAIPDQSTGVPVAEFPIDFWAALANAGNQSQQYDIVFSANGTDWEILSTSSSFPILRGVGVDQLFVGYGDGGVPGASFAPRTETIPIPLLTTDE